MPNRARFKDLEGTILVVTYGRSGSTLLQNLLNALPGHCIRGENGNLLLPLAQAWTRLRNTPNVRRLARNRTRTGPENPWFGAENIDDRRFGRALAQSFVREVLAPPEGTRVTGFKEIRWAESRTSLPAMLDFARAFLPGVRIVFNTRDHAQVARSGWWAEQDPDTVRARLAAMEAQYHAYMQRHPECCLHVHYDDYVQDHAALAPLFAFLGQPFDPAMVAAVMARRLTHLQPDTPS